MSCTNHWQGPYEPDEFDRKQDEEEAEQHRIYEASIAREWDGPRVDIRQGDIWLKHSNKRLIQISSPGNRPFMNVTAYNADRTKGTLTAKRMPGQHDRRNFGIAGSKGYTLIERDGKPV